MGRLEYAKSTREMVKVNPRHSHNDRSEFGNFWRGNQMADLTFGEANVSALAAERNRQRDNSSE